MPGVGGLPRPSECPSSAAQLPAAKPSPGRPGNKAARGTRRARSPRDRRRRTTKGGLEQGGRSREMEAPAEQTRKVSLRTSQARAPAPSPGPAVSPLPGAPPGVRLAVLSRRRSGRWCPLSPQPLSPPSQGRLGASRRKSRPSPVPPARRIGIWGPSQPHSGLSISAPGPAPTLTGPRPRQPVGTGAAGSAHARR